VRSAKLITAGQESLTVCYGELRLSGTGRTATVDDRAEFGQLRS